MRSSLLLSAFCAAGALGAHIPHNHRRVYVTDLTVVTVTETLTVQPTPDPVTNLPVQKVETQEPTTTTTIDPPPAPTPEPEPEPEPSPSPDNAAAEEVVVLTTVVTEAPPTTTSPPPPPPPPPTTLVTTTAPPAPAPTTNNYQGLVLHNHNVHRSNHSASDMTWSSTLEASAYKLAASCVYQHDTSIDGGGYGQNIGYGVAADNVGVMISNLMYNDEFEFFKPYFGVADPDMSNFDAWGHLTQILWKGSTEVGCATVMCNGLGNVDSSVPLPFTVCNYGPPGNVAGGYAKNVGLPQGQPIFSA